MLGLSLGSTSMSRLTWNKSGYFSWMSQASKSYLKGGKRCNLKENKKKTDKAGNSAQKKKQRNSFCILCKLDSGRISGDEARVELNLEHLHGCHLKHSSP